MSSPPKCKVYLWLDNNIPFYVGIGPESRAKCRKHNKQAEGRRKNSEARKSFCIEFVFSGSRPSCEDIETHLIACYGSIANGGLLANFTPGGDGLKGKENLTEDQLEKMRDGGRKGGFTSKPTIKVCKLGGSVQGKNNVKSGHISKLADLNSKKWVLLDPAGNVITFYNLSRFCRENSLSVGNINLVLSGKRSHHKGYRRYEH
jgi:hypothetical protein